jgi:hypothetical protein
MTDKPDRKRWRWVTAAVALFAAYMGAYYATVTIDQNGAFERRQTYMIWLWELPSWSRVSFAPADWIDDRIHLAPCKNPPVINPIR